MNAPFPCLRGHALRLALCSAVLLLWLLPGPAQAQSHRPRGAPPPPAFEHDHNPYSGDPEKADEGRVLYNKTCIICHGPDGKGLRGPNLRESKLNGIPFLAIVWRGRKGTQMPAWKGILTEDEIWKIMTYLGR